MKAFCGSGIGKIAPFAAAWGQAEKVLRGGSWNNNANNIRAANRNNNPDNSNNNNGFRCASSPGVLLKGQVRRVHGRGAGAEREKTPGLFPVGAPPLVVCPTKDKPAPPSVVGSGRCLRIRGSGRGPSWTPERRPRAGGTDRRATKSPGYRAAPDQSGLKASWPVSQPRSRGVAAKPRHFMPGRPAQPGPFLVGTMVTGRDRRAMKRGLNPDL
jgi:hypothetical protein